MKNLLFLVSFMIFILSSSVCSSNHKLLSILEFSELIDDISSLSAETSILLPPFVVSKS